MIAMRQMSRSEIILITVPYSALVQQGRERVTLAQLDRRDDIKESLPGLFVVEPRLMRSRINMKVTLC
jgi:hypothetical protein